MATQVNFCLFLNVFVWLAILFLTIGTFVLLKVLPTYLAREASDTVSLCIGKVKLKYRGMVSRNRAILQ